MYLDVPVPAALTGVVTGIAGYDEASATPVRRREIPSGSCTLILGFGTPVLDGLGPAFLAGMHDVAAHTEFVGHQRGVQVDLAPLGVLRLLGRPVRDLTARAVELDALDAPDLAALPARLAERTSWAERFADVTAVLIRRLAAATVAPDPEVAWAWGELARSGGRVPVSTLADGTGWSRRHLLTRFRAQVGLAPTPAGRVLRFRRAAQALVPGRGPDRVLTASRVADVAAACGYADHAHLVREFRAIAGCTPSAFVAEWAGELAPAENIGETGHFPDVQATGAPRS